MGVRMYLGLKDYASKMWFLKLKNQSKMLFYITSKHIVFPTICLGWSRL